MSSEPVKLSDTVPELFHYTTNEGLYGILTSQMLWATEAGHLNDHTEIRWFFDKRLPHLVKPVIRAVLTERQRERRIAELIESMGGLEPTIKQGVTEFAEPLRDVTMHVNATYVTSFCSTSDPWTARNGLLSQWRGYAGYGGYAIVFDSAKLLEAVKRESGAYFYTFTGLEPVFYYGDADSERRNHPLAIQRVEKHEAVLIERARDLLAETGARWPLAYEAVTQLSCTYKNWGFHEEQEVRIVAVPATLEHFKQAQKSTASYPPLKTVKHSSRHGELVPYVELFGCGELLPINRIIVGPHPDREARRHGVESLMRQCGINADVVCSEIPLRSR